MSRPDLSDVHVTVTADSGRTLETIRKVYGAYLGGDPDAMADTLAVDAWVRFLGQVELWGRERARELFTANEDLLSDLTFTIERLVVDGDHAAAIWNERAVTRDGNEWQNHGVDVFGVVDGEVTFLHENNDVVTFRQHFG
jgi:ketosteroid isomerase-like protein